MSVCTIHSYRSDNNPRLIRIQLSENKLEFIEQHEHHRSGACQKEYEVINLAGQGVHRPGGRGSPTD